MKLLILKMLFIYAFLFPSFYNILGTKGLAIVNGGVIALGLLIILNQRQIYFHQRTEKQIFMPILFSLLVYFTLIGLASIINNYDNLILDDLFDYHRPILLFVSFSLPFFIIKEKRDVFHITQFTGKFFTFSIWSIFIIGFFHLYETPNMKNIIGFYTKVANINSYRLSAPFANPYDLAIFLILLFNYFLLSFIYKRFLYILPLFISFVILLFTQSRIGFISLIFAFSILTFMLMKPQKNFKLNKPVVFKILPLFILMGITFAYIFPKLSYLYSGFISYLSEESFSSWDLRKKQIYLALNLFEDKILAFLIGFGPAKEILKYPENNHLYYLFRYGIIGEILFFIIPSILGIFYSYKTYKKSISMEVKIIFLSLCVWILTVLSVASLGNNFSEQMRLSFFYWFFIGFVVRSYFTLFNA